MSLRPAAALLAMAAATAVMPAHADQAKSNSLDGGARLSALRLESPDARFYFTPAGRLASVYGNPVSFGDTAIQSAATFAAKHSGVFGVPATDLRIGSTMTEAGATQSLVFDEETNDYRFTLVYYSQFRDGYPVFRSDLRLLTRNEPGFPLVLAKSALRELGNFRVPADWQAKAISLQDAQDLVRSKYPSLVNFTNPRVVIWAGYDETDAEPRLAYEFAADNAGTNAPTPMAQIFLIDVATGGILFSESQILHADVTGTVKGRITDNFVAAICEEESLQPMPYARVIAGGVTGYADVDGNFTISTSESDNITVESPMSGRYFRMTDVAAPLDNLSQAMASPGSVDFIHNNANANAYIVAQANSYYHANVVRDYAIRYSPSYPTIVNQVDFPIRVNINDSCNAYYDGVSPSIHFFRALNGCSNTAFGTVVHHEYGHHLVARGGSGQGAYGEGMSDVMALLITDSPALGYGFYNCQGSLRNAINDCQYLTTGCSTCGSFAHGCGQVLSGSVWSTRELMAVSHPLTYRDSLSRIAVNAILLHQGTTITPQITIDYLTLDDIDATLDNGTPHYVEINAGFGAHSLPGPNLPPLDFIYPEGRPNLASPNGTTTVTVKIASITATLQPGTTTLHYDLGDGYVAVPMVDLGNSTYRGTFPTTTCGTAIPYYISAQTTSLNTVTSPLSAPEAHYVTTSGHSLEMRFSDDFETNKGWQAGLVTDTATSGRWVRVDPNGTAAAPEDDTTPAPGTQCYVTGQGTVGGALGQADLDNGYTTLVSPSFDLSGLLHSKINYYRWFSNDTGGAPHTDIFTVQISNDNGSSWVTAEIVGPTGPESEAGWFFHEIDVESFLPATNQMKVRFIADDAGVGSVVEAAVDDFNAYGYLCNAGCPGDYNGDDTVNSQDFFDFLTAFFAGSADFNNDSVTNSQDFFDFLTEFFKPCV